MVRVIFSLPRQSHLVHLGGVSGGGARRIGRMLARSRERVTCNVFIDKALVQMAMDFLTVILYI